MFLKDSPHSNMGKSHKYIVQRRKPWRQRIHAGFLYPKSESEHNASMLTEVRMVVSVESSWYLEGSRRQLEDEGAGSRSSSGCRL